MPAVVLAQTFHADRRRLRAAAEAALRDVNAQFVRRTGFREVRGLLHWSLFNRGDRVVVRVFDREVEVESRHANPFTWFPNPRLLERNCDRVLDAIADRLADR